MKFHLRIIGQGYRFLYFEEGHYFMEKFRNQPPELMNQVIFENELLLKRRILNSRDVLIQTPEDAEPTKVGYIYDTNLITRMEIKSSESKRIKIRFYDLRSDEMLFGFANVEAIPFFENGLLILEKCMGSFGKTSIDEEAITFNDINFRISYVDLLKGNFLSDILIKDKHLKFKGDDLICTSRRAYYLKRH